MPKNETNRVKKLMALRKDTVEYNRRMLPYYDWNMSIDDFVMSNELIKLLTSPSAAMQAFQEVGAAISGIAKGASQIVEGLSSRGSVGSPYVYSVAVDMTTQLDSKERRPALIVDETFPGYGACFKYLTFGCGYSEEKVVEILEEIKNNFEFCEGNLPEETPLRVMLTNYTGVTIEQSRFIYGILKNYDSDTEKQELMLKKSVRDQAEEFPGHYLIVTYLVGKNYAKNSIDDIIEATAWSYVESLSVDLPLFDNWRRIIETKTKIKFPLGDLTFCYDVMRREWREMKKEIRLQSYGDKGRPAPVSQAEYPQKPSETNAERLERYGLQRIAADETERYSYDKNKYGDRGEPIGGPVLKAFEKPKGSYWQITIEGPANALRNLYQRQCVAFEEAVFQIEIIEERMENPPRITFIMVHRPDIETNGDMPVMLFDKRDLAKIGINDFSRLMAEDRVEYLKSSSIAISGIAVSVSKGKTILAEPMESKGVTLPAGTVMVQNPTTGNYEPLTGVTNLKAIYSKEKQADVNPLAPVRRKINLEHEE